MAKLYSTWGPSPHDTKGLGLPDRQDWFVAPCAHNRDSDPYDESNFYTALKMLGGESDTVEVHRFGHWAVGWFEIILVAPEHEQTLDEIATCLADYPLLDENDVSEHEQEAADEIWKNCFNPQERLAYIRKYRNQFEFRGFADLLGCVRGRYFAGDASELIGS